MAVPLTLSQIRQALTAEGVHYAVTPDAETNNRNAVGPWGPLNGVMIHHTAGTNSLALVRKGRSDLPGPLAQAHLSKVGLLAVVSTGRANHAGPGSRAVWNSVVNEVSVPRPGPDEVDGNRHFYGIEIENLGNGTDPYPAVQYDQAVRWTAALCRAHRWSALSVIGHKEWTTRKKDPSFDMNAFRREVAVRLLHPASWTPGEETPVTDVPGLDVEAPKPVAYSQVLETDSLPAPRNHPDSETHKFWTGESYLRFIAEQLIEISKRLDS